MALSRRVQANTLIDRIAGTVAIRAAALMHTCCNLKGLGARRTHVEQRKRNRIESDLARGFKP